MDGSRAVSTSVARRRRADQLVTTPDIGSRPAGGSKAPSRAGSHPVAEPSAAAPPSDLTTYILELEAQNRDLRYHIEALQQEARSRPAGLGSAGNSPFLGNMGRQALTTEAERKAFLTDVLSQIEVIIQAHRNKSAAEIQKYRQEAEMARGALRSLREAIQHDGMDLVLAPSLLTAKINLSDEPSADIRVPRESEGILQKVAQDMLRRIVGLESGTDLAVAVHTEVKRGFRHMLDHFARQIMLATQDSAAALSDMRAEADREKAELRTQLHMSEESRVMLVRNHEIEINAVRDELRAFHMATADDDVERSLHQRALEEYNRMLVAAREEALCLREDLEAERNSCAEVCLRLKTTLQRRSADFEKVVVEQAEALVADRDKRIADMAAEISVLKGPPKEVRNSASQAGEAGILSFTPDAYVSNVLRTIRKDPNAMGELSDHREREVWRRTHDLLTKYGGLQPGPSPSST